MGEVLGRAVSGTEAVSREQWPERLKNGLDALNIAGTYTLAFNGSLMVEDGMGCALCLDRIINLGEDSPLCFRPLEPRREAGMHIIWKKYQVFSKVAGTFLRSVRELIAHEV